MIERTHAPANVNTMPLAGGPPTAPRGAEPAPLLPAPDTVSGDPIAMIAKLLVKSSQQKRQSDDLTAAVEEKAEDAADAQRIAAMKDKADKNFTAGMIGGLSQMGAGACSVSAGLASASALNKPGPPLGPDGKALTPDFRSDFAGSASKTWDGTGQILGGAGKVGETVFKAAADRADQDIAKAESEGKVHKRAAEALHKEVDAASQHEGKVMQLLQEIKQAQQQCEHAALLKMA